MAIRYCMCRLSVRLCLGLEALKLENGIYVQALSFQKKEAISGGAETEI